MKVLVHNNLGFGIQEQGGKKKPTLVIIDFNDEAKESTVATFISQKLAEEFYDQLLRNINGEIRIIDGSGPGRV